MASACSESPLKKEQYKKEIYLIGAYDRVWVTKVDYVNQGEEAETYFTISSSGTLPLDKDVKVELSVNQDLVNIYNRKYLTIKDKDKYYKNLPTEWYNIPDIDNNSVEIKHEQGISVKVPVKIKSSDICVDSLYVIPVQIDTVHAYSVVPGGKKMLIKIEMRNKYSGGYKMDGYKTDSYGTPEQSMPKRIQKNKQVLPTGVNSVRIFFGMNNESKIKEDIASKTIKISITDEQFGDNPLFKKLRIEKWNETADFQLEDLSESYYDTEKEIFHLKYKVGTSLYEEKLSREKKVKY